MLKAILASLFVLCVNFLLVTSILPYTVGSCVMTLLLADAATVGVYYLALREIGYRAERAGTATLAFAIASLFLVNGLGTLIGVYLFRARHAGDVAFFDMQYLTIFFMVSLWGRARKVSA